MTDRRRRRGRRNRHRRRKRARTARRRTLAELLDVTPWALRFRLDHTTTRRALRRLTRSDRP